MRTPGEVEQGGLAGGLGGLAGGLAGDFGGTRLYLGGLAPQMGAFSSVLRGARPRPRWAFIILKGGESGGSGLARRVGLPVSARF